MDVRLVVERGGQRNHSFKVRGAAMVVGRKSGCGVRIPSAAVSREHCRLLLADGFLTAEDLDSINGTHLNGQPIAGRVAVRPGDRLKIGPVIFVVEYELSHAGLNRLLAWEARQNGEEAEELDEFELLEEAPAEEGDVPVPLELTLSDDEASGQEAEAEEVTSPDMFPFDNDQPMELPAADQLREFLSQLEKPAEDERGT